MCVGRWDASGLPQVRHVWIQATDHCAGRARLVANEAFGVPGTTGRALGWKHPLKARGGYAMFRNALWGSAAVLESARKRRIDVYIYTLYIYKHNFDPSQLQQVWIRIQTKKFNYQKCGLNQQRDKHVDLTWFNYGLQMWFWTSYQIRLMEFTKHGSWTAKHTDATNNSLHLIETTSMDIIAIPRAKNKLYANNTENKK